MSGFLDTITACEGKQAVFACERGCELPPKLLSAGELAETLDVPYGDILSWHRTGVIPVIRAGGRLYFNLAAVVKALRAHAEAREAEAPEPAGAAP
jgi:hypothetical protein